MNATDNKNEYKIFCEQNNVPLFSQYWWMEAACVGKQWDVLLYKENGQIVASMPYMLSRKFGQTFIIQPQLTQTNGVYIANLENIEPNKRISIEEKVYANIIEQLSCLNVGYFQQCFHHSAVNWQPFYWEGFTQTTRYTYIIDDIADTDAVFNNFHLSKKRHINKAIRNGLFVDTNIGAEEFYNFHLYTTKQKGEAHLVSKEVEVAIIDSAIQRGQGKIIGVRDADNNLHSANFIAWDKHTAYLLLIANNITYKTSGASSLAIYESIKFASAQHIQSFDFEGSMSKNIAEAYKNFGGRPMPYFKIEKANSLIFKLMKAVEFLK